MAEPENPNSGNAPEPEAENPVPAGDAQEGHSAGEPVAGQADTNEGSESPVDTTSALLARQETEAVVAKITDEKRALEQEVQRLRKLVQRDQEIETQREEDFQARLDQQAKNFITSKLEEIAALDQRIADARKAEAAATQRRAQAEADATAAQTISAAQMRAQQANAAQQNAQLTGANQNADTKTFSDHHLEVLGKYTGKFITLHRDDEDSDDIHAGVNYSIAHGDPNKPQLKKAFSATPRGVEIHAFDNDTVLAESIRLAVQLHNGDFKTLARTATHEQKIKIYQVTKQLFEAGELVDKNGVAFKTVSFNGHVFGEAAPILSANNSPTGAEPMPLPPGPPQPPHLKFNATA